MTDGEGGASTRLTPDDAFAILANETRFEIVRTLWELYDPADPANVVKFEDSRDGDTGVTFSELFERVDYEDSGNFTYHLDRLTDHFVRRTEGGYELTEAGFEIARAVVAGTIRERPRIHGAVIDEPCPRCDGPIVVTYDDHNLSAVCDRCPGLWQDDRASGLLFRLPLPPAGLAGRTPTDAFHATITYNFTRVRSYVAGVCPDCSGEIERTLDVCDAHEPGDRGACPTCRRQHAVEFFGVCRRCSSDSRGPLTIEVLAHPTVTAFLHDHGIEHQFASWSSFVRAQTVSEEVLETDPLRIRVTVPCEDDRLRLTLDETLSIVEAVRETSIA